MLATYLLLVVFVMWSARAIRSLCQALRGETPKLSFGDEISTAGFALCAWYLGMKIVGWT